MLLGWQKALFFFRRHYSIWRQLAQLDSWLRETWVTNKQSIEHPLIRKWSCDGARLLCIQSDHHISMDDGMAAWKQFWAQTILTICNVWNIDVCLWASGGAREGRTILGSCPVFLRGHGFPKFDSFLHTPRAPALGAPRARSPAPLASTIIRHWCEPPNW